MLGASGRYRFIGISVSSNAVSGSSTEATAEAQTAAPSRKRISAQRTRVTSTHPKCHAPYSSKRSLSIKIVSKIVSIKIVSCCLLCRTFCFSRTCKAHPAVAITACPTPTGATPSKITSTTFVSPFRL